MTASMRSAQATLHLDLLTVVHAGDSTFPLADGVTAVGFERMFDDIEPLSQ